MKIKRLLQNFFLIAASTIIAVVIGEIGIRLIKPVYDYADRSLLFSLPAFKRYSGGAVRYYPHEKIREVAVYNDKVEYDVKYQTNNLGFIDTKDYKYESVSGQRYYAFVGDSFTAGVNAGSPWVPMLRNNKLHAEIYNMGVAGTGFEHFYRLLHDMKARVKITHIILVAITDDFYRTYWHPLIADGNICFCSEIDPHSRCQPLPIASIIALDAPESEVRKVAKEKYAGRAKMKRYNAADSLLTKAESLISDESAIYYYSRVLLDSYNRSHKPSNIEFALEEIRKIKDEFPAAEIDLIHLPQKYEVLTNNYYINIADQVAGLGVKYYPALEKCNWSMDMFFIRDGHPNKRGYENITKCVSDYLFDSDNAVGPDTSNH